MSTVSERLYTLCDKHIDGIEFTTSDNLFELGISSLTLAEIHASIDDEWPGLVDITDLFDYPTIDQLSLLLETRQANTA